MLAEQYECVEDAMRGMTVRSSQRIGYVVMMSTLSLGLGLPVLVSLTGACSS